MHYSRRREARGRGHGITPEILANLKRQFAKHPVGTLLRRDGSVLSLGNGQPGSGALKRYGRRGNVETRTSRSTLTPAQQATLAKAERTLASRPADRLAAARRKAEQVKAAATAHLYHDD